jgi:hypothetical protein
MPIQEMIPVKILRYLSVATVLAALSSCNDLIVADLNNPGLDQLSESPTRSAVIAATQGLFISARVAMASRAGYVSALGIIGRESYNFDGSDPGFSTEMLVGPLDGGSPAFGGALWTPRYRAVRGAANVLLAVAEVSDADLPPAEKSGIRGIANTMMALQLLLVLNTRDTNGIPTTTNPDPTGDPTPFRTKSEAFADIVALLESAATDLGAAGTSFASDLSLPPGYATANTPADFLAFNRALRARVAVYMGDFSEALTTYLPASFLDDTAPFSLGVSYDFGIGAGEIQNLLFDQSGVLLGHPSIRTDAQLQGGGAIDQRALDKTTVLATPIPDQASLGISSDLQFTHYASPTASLPIIRNEELILLRAEANLGAGSAAAALTDINLVRTTAGGLDAITVGAWAAMTATQQLDELLYNKRYSLLWEGGHRWIDMRRYGKLAEIPLDLPSFTIPTAYPVPTQECDQRGDNPPPSC